MTQRRAMAKKTKKTAKRASKKAKSKKRPILRAGMNKSDFVDKLAH